MHGRTAAAAGIALLLLAITGAAIYGILTPARPAVEIPVGSRASTGGGVTGGVTGGAGFQPAQSASTALAEANPLLTNGQYARAEAVLTAAVDRAPQDQELRTTLARALIGEQKYKEAANQLDAAITIGPDTAPIRAMAGSCANKAGNLDLAVEHFSKAEQLAPADPKHPLYLAMIQIKKGDDAAASASLFRALKHDPNLAEAWGTLAELALKNNQLDMTLQYVEKARALQPDSTKWRLAEAKAHKRQGEPQKAIDLLVNLPDRERYRDDVLQQLAECYALLKKPQEAAKLYEAAAKSRPEAAEALATQAAQWRSK